MPIKEFNEKRAISALLCACKMLDCDVWRTHSNNKDRNTHEISFCLQPLTLQVDIIYLSVRHTETYKGKSVIRKKTMVSHETDIVISIFIVQMSKQ